MRSVVAERNIKNCDFNNIDFNFPFLFIYAGNECMKMKFLKGSDNKREFQ